MQINNLHEQFQSSINDQLQSFLCLYYPQITNQPIFYPPMFPRPGKENRNTCKNQNQTQNLSNLCAIVSRCQSKMAQLQKQIDRLMVENGEYRKQLQPKRKYSKRRENLPKEFVCDFEDCCKKYSSSIALQCHYKKKHAA